MAAAAHEHERQIATGNRCLMRAYVISPCFGRIYWSAYTGAWPHLSRMARTDGRDADAGAVHRPRLALRAQARRHPPARVQARRRRHASTRATASAQNHDYPSVVDAIATLPVKDAILDGEATGVWGQPGRADVSRVRRAVARRPRRDSRFRSTNAARCSQSCRSTRRSRACAAIDERHAVGARVRRGLGRRDREAPRRALRAPALARTG